ncbi:hypothetical protein J7E50_10980 [Pedobacter sp. ISL-68]|uniref:hypothetical protein n=1 Tax=unclassified Pedobacter TaxID=2628915 RepID=UPI001BE9D86F|nr:MULTISPECIES: hypothetical protein [unclassified Pedobacter]MBT2561356.1 hypothetical protein [Pedobacter sp. ISL-64]MBT2590745.1 hypothetical protein [Pedobacter sp. ISL-68]
MSNQQTPEKTMIDEVVENLIRKTDFLEKELTTKNAAILQKEEQTQSLIANFEQKFSNVVIQGPKPDLSEINATLKNGLSGINQSMKKWPTPLKKEFRFIFFPEQLRSVEYVRAVLTRVIVCILTFVFLIFAYLLMDKHLK